MCIRDRLVNARFSRGKFPGCFKDKSVFLKDRATVSYTHLAASLAMEAGATFSATAAQYGFNAALLACPITWIIILIIALIALFLSLIHI